MENLGNQEPKLSWKRPKPAFEKHSGDLWVWYLVATASNGGKRWAKETGPAAVTLVAPSFHDPLRCDTGGLPAEFTVFQADWIPSHES